MLTDNYALAVLALNDAEKEITAENIMKFMEKTKSKPEKKVVEMYADAMKYIKIDEMIASFTKVGGAAPSAAAPAAEVAAVEAPKEAAKEESEEESEGDMGFGLFD